MLRALQKITNGMPSKETFCLNLAGFDFEYGAASNPWSRSCFDGCFAVMTTEDCSARYARPIAALWKTVATRYSVTEREFAGRLAVILARNGNSYESKGVDADSTSNCITNLRAGELCLA